MKKQWVVGVSSYSGNAKWLYQYITQFYQETIDIVWIADNEERLAEIKQANSSVKIILRDSKEADKIFSYTDVYVEEQFREFYPETLNKNAVFLNLWHGVGLKDIEINYPFNGDLAKRIAKKTIKYFDEYYRRTLFLVTSVEMETHFSKNVVTPTTNYIRAGYPRVELLKKINYNKRDLRAEKGLTSDSKIAMFAPTFRNQQMNDSVKNLLPDFEKLENSLRKSNTLLIINLHPIMRSDNFYKAAMLKYENSQHFVFISGEDDIYELFNQIDYTIIDYSSIFYDLMAAGADQFVRYIPDYEEYKKYYENMDMYLEKTYGETITSFKDLLNYIENHRSDNESFSTKKKELMEYFFSYADGVEGIDRMIEAANQFTFEVESNLPTLQSYDIFDTLIKRRTGLPKGIFYYVQQRMFDSNLKFPRYVLTNYPQVRQQAEAAARDRARKTVFERQTDKIEITFDNIFEQMSEVYPLTTEQIKFLKEVEVAAEIDHSEPIVSRIDQMIEQSNNGDKVILISDMYLPKEVITKMMIKADPRLSQFDFYLSSDLGYQKTTGLLYQYVFFNCRYKYKEWIHYGDNNFADKKVPKRYGIQVVGHRFWNFNEYESQIVEKLQNYDSFLVANLMKELRKKMWYRNLESGKYKKKVYYAFAYSSLYIVPYVDWAIREAIKTKNDTIYFISRDGNFLKQVADIIIEQKQYAIKTKLIYGSRKVWRIPGLVKKVDEEVFSHFGLFQSIENYDELLEIAQLSEQQFDEFFPTLEYLKTKELFDGKDIALIRSTAQVSEAYRQHLLDVSKQQREIVTDYLSSEIDFNEKFIFVEYWGRGYTQDSLTNLLEATAGYPVKTEMYYARSIYGSKGNSLRKNFTNSTKDLTFIESIFNYVPMKSLASYSRDEKGNVQPDIVPQPNEFAELFEKYTLDFASRYASLDLIDEDETNRAMFDYAVNYFHTNPSDPVIVEVFSSFKDNIALNGKPVEFAPILLARDILKTPINQTKKRTKSIDMSLAKSSVNARLAYALREKYEDSKRKIKRKFKRK